MIKLKCQSCGGEMSVTEDKVEAVTGRVVQLNRKVIIECLYCGEKYLQFDELALMPGQPSLKITQTAVVFGDGAVAQGPGSVAAGKGGIAIGGTVKGIAITPDGPEVEE